MYKKLNFYLIFIIPILAIASIFISSCSDIYEDMSLSLDMEEVVIYLNDPEQASNTINATVQKVPDGVSPNLTYFVKNRDILNVSTLERDGNTTTVLLSPLNPGHTTVEVKTVEGDKTVKFEVTVIQPIEDMRLKEDDYREVINVGEASRIDIVDIVNFYPSNTNQTRTSLAVVDYGELDSSDIIIDGHIITVLSLLEADIQIKIVSAENLEIYTTITIKVIEPVYDENLNITVNDENLEDDDGLILSTNIVKYSHLKLEINLDKPISFETQLVTQSGLVESIERTLNTYDLYAVKEGETTIQVKGYISGYNNSIFSKELNLSVLHYPQEVQVNSSNISSQQHNVFDNYAEGVLGTEFNVEVLQRNSYNRDYKLHLVDHLNMIDIVEVFDNDGEIVFFDNDGYSLKSYSTGTSFYVRVKNLDNIEVENNGELGFSLDVVAVGALSLDSNNAITRLVLSALRGASSLNIYGYEHTHLQNEDLDAWTSLSGSIEMEIYDSNYLYLKGVPTNSFVRNGSVIVDYDSSFLDIEEHEDKVAFFDEEMSDPYPDIENFLGYSIKGVKEGLTNIRFMTVTGHIFQFNIYIFQPVEFIYADINNMDIDSTVGDFDEDILTSSSGSSFATLEGIHLSINREYMINIGRYPFDSTISSKEFNSTNTNIFTASSAAFINTRGEGVANINISVSTPTQKSFGISQEKLVHQSFQVSVYIPISSTRINHTQYSLIDNGDLGYFDKERSQVQLSININPVNSTFSDIDWSASNNLIDVDQDGLVTAVMSDAEPGAQVGSAVVTATIREFDRYYRQRTLVNITRGISSNNIVVKNVDHNYIYFDSRLGLGQSSGNEFKIESEVRPFEATNNRLTYVLFMDVTPGAGSVVTVRSDGTIIPNRAGEAIIHVIAEDSFTSPIDYSRYREIRVRVADGQSKENPLEIRSENDFLDINTESGLQLHYVLANDVSLSRIDFSEFSLGIVDGFNYGFSGSISGYYQFEGLEVINSFNGINYSITAGERAIYNLSIISKINYGAEILDVRFNFEQSVISPSAGPRISSGALNFGGVALLNEGVLDNVDVYFSNLEILRTTRNANSIGGIVNENSGKIRNSRVSGNIFVTASTIQHSMMPDIYFGGVAAKNTSVGEITQDLNSEIISDINQSTANLSIEKIALLDTDLLGAIVAYNEGLIEGVTSNSYIISRYGIGGIAGSNSGTIKNVRSFSLLKGEKFIGGIAAYNYEQILSSNVLLLDRIDFPDRFSGQISGYNFVGGVVGHQSDQAIIRNTYVRSFYTEDDLIDIHLTGSGNLNDIYAGGIVGHSDNSSIEKAYFEGVIHSDIDTADEVYIGGIAGQISEGGDYTNLYTVGTISSIENNHTDYYLAALIGFINPASLAASFNNIYSNMDIGDSNSMNDDTLVAYNQNYSNFNNIVYNYEKLNYTGQNDQIIGLNDDQMLVISNYRQNDAGFEVEIWDIVLELNDGLPVLRYGDGEYLYIQIPTHIEAEVNKGLENVSPAEFDSRDLTNPESIRHIKLPEGSFDADALLFYYSKGGEENIYSLEDDNFGILSKTVLPEGAVDNNLIQVVSYDPELVRIRDNRSELEVRGTGHVIIKITSALNRDVYDYISVYITKPVSGFDINVLNEDTGDVRSVYDEVLRIKKDTTIRLTPEVQANSDGKEFSYDPDTYIMYNFSGYDSIIFEGHPGYEPNIHYREGNILRAIEQSDYINVSTTPAVKINGEFLPLLFLEREFDVNVYEGPEQINVINESVNMSLRDIYMLEIDLIGDTVNNKYKVAPVMNDLEIYSDEIAIESLGNNILANGNTRYTFKVYFVRDFVESGNYASDYSYNIGFGIHYVENSGKSSEFSHLDSEFKLNLIPQSLIRTDLDFFPYSQRTTVYDASSGLTELYNPDEFSSGEIYAGRVGLLEISNYPEFADMDYMEITYSTTSQYSISFKQMLLDQRFFESESSADSKYREITPQSELIQNGIRLSLNSIYNGESSEYNGKLFVKLLISSFVQEGEEFYLDVTSFNSNGLPVLTTTKTLTTLPASRIEVRHNNHSTAYLAGGIEEEIEIRTVGMLNKDISLSNFNIDGINLDVTPLPSRTRIQGSSKFFYFRVVASDSITDDPGTISIQYNEQIGNSVRTYESNEMDVHINYYTIDSVRLRNENFERSTSTLAIPYGNRFALVAEINAKYSNSFIESQEGITVEDVKEHIENLEKQISSNLDSWYTREFVDGEYLYAPLTAGQDNYDNFKIDSDDESPIGITPLRIAQGDLFALRYRYNYLSGFPKLNINDWSTQQPGYKYNGDILREVTFDSRFYLRTEEDNPVPIYTVADFMAMEQQGNYILMNNLTLGQESAYVPLDVNLSSFDGNSYIISIKEFYIEQGEDDDLGLLRLGLFERVYTDMLVSNAFLNLSSIAIAANNHTNINIGGLAAINDGIIYNSHVYTGINSPIDISTRLEVSETTVTTLIGGIVAINNGNILHTRSEVSIITSRGLLSGFVAENNGRIVSSFYRMGRLENSSPQTREGSALSGFVINNNAQGRIMYSYSEGFIGESGDILDYIEDDRRIIGQGLFSGSAYVAGFVYDNAGEVKDSYSNIRVRGESRTSGFVFFNSGDIINSVSKSRVQLNNAAHTPFTGTNTMDLPNNSGNITSSYYLDGNFAGKIQEPANRVHSTNWADENSFSISFQKESGQPGSWLMTDENNLPAEIKTLRIVGADYIAAYRRNISGIEHEEGAGPIYAYAFQDKEDVDVNNNTYLTGSIGTSNSPFYIRTAQSFNNDIIDSIDQGENKVFRILTDIGFSDELEYTDLITTTFNGEIHGNGMSISNVRVIASESQEGIGKVGMFKAIENSDIRNLNIRISEYFATNMNVVGGIAGEVLDSSLYGVSVESPQNIIIQGRNIVGGVAGIIKGDSYIVNSSSAISVNATYRRTLELGDAYNIYNGTNFDSISYAGSIAGIIDDNAVGHNLSVNGADVVGESAGTVFGLVSNDVEIQNINSEVSDNQVLRSSRMSGGIVGENRGTIINANIYYSEDVEASMSQLRYGNHVNYRDNTFFTGTSKASGGIVGINFGGTIKDSYSSISVNNPNSNRSGGIVGVTLGGEILNNTVNGSTIFAAEVIGGVIGSYIQYDYNEEISGGIIETLFTESSIDYLTAYAKEIENESNVDIEGNNIYTNWALAYYDIFLAHEDDNAPIRAVGSIVGSSHISISGAELSYQGNLIRDRLYDRINHNSSTGYYEFHKKGMETTDGYNIAFGESENFNFPDWKDAQQDEEGVLYYEAYYINSKIQQ